MTLSRALGVQWTSTIYVAGVSALLTFALGRLLGPEAFGRYSAVWALAAIFGIIQDGGFKTLIYRETSQPTPGKESFRNALLPTALGRLILATGVGMLLGPLLPLGDPWATAPAILAVGLFVLTSFRSSQLRGEGRFTDDARWIASARTASVIGVGLALGAGVREPFLLFSALAAGLVLVLFTRRGRKVLVLPRFRLDPELQRAALAFLTIDAATVIYFRSDILLLELLGEGSAAAGEYAAAYAFLEGVILLASPVGVVAFHYLRRCMDAPRPFAALFVPLFLGMLGVGAVVALAGWALATPLIHLTYGEAYALAPALLGWLFPALFFIMPNAILTQGAIALNRERIYAAAAVGSAVLNILLNLLLIPDHGPFGAAWATLTTEAVLLAVLTIDLARHRRRMERAHEA